MSRKLDRTISVLNAIVGDYLRRRENGLVGGIVAIAVDAAGSAPARPRLRTAIGRRAGDARSARFFASIRLESTK